MRTNFDPEPEDPLVEATLRDETWQAANAAFKTAALRTFRTRQRVRRVTRWAGSVAAIAAVLIGVVHWLGRSAPTSSQVVVAMTPVPKAPDKFRPLTDRDLVAAFPKGSCFIAEVDGRKELIFLDREVERTYVSRPGASGN